MNDIDLIPQDYHRKQLLTGWLKLAISVQVLISILVGTTFVWLSINSSDIQQKIKQLQTQKAITNTHRSKLQKLNQQKNDLDQQLKLLAGLRSGAAAEQMFMTIDAALPEKNIWVTGWKFRRAGTPVESAGNTVNTGYFIVIQQDNRSKNKQQETWKIETQMTLLGQSLDHAAISEFVLNLTRQPEIENVRVVSTQLSQINHTKLVNFSLEIVVSALQEKV